MRRHTSAAERLGRLPATALSRCLAGLRSIAFWGAVLLPLCYPPLLVLDGPDELLAGIVALNVTCLLVGHRYRPSQEAGRLAIAARWALRTGGKH